MEFLRRLFYKEREELPRKDDVCEEILRVVRAKMRDGSVFKNQYPLEYVLLDDRHPSRIFSDVCPAITLHLLRHKMRIDGSNTDSFRLRKDTYNRWSAEYEDPGANWKELTGDKGVRKLVHLLKCVGKARVGKTYP